MGRIHSVALTSLLIAGVGFSQGSDTDYHHNDVVFGVGPAIPVGNSTNYLSTAPLIDFAYGYRFNRLFQADVGLQIAFGAANNQNAEITNFGTVQGGDHEFMVPLGGRVYIPQPFKRFDVSVGGGTAYLHYSETAPSGEPGYSLGCYSCTSRGGWGGYGLANVRYYLDSNHNFHVGTTFQYIVAATNGQAVGNVPALRTTDHWTNILFEFGLSF
ncbi:MAG: hypothetical protein ABSB35_02050 [Bryobacteraceae bacterium]|jgi:hypothetical protein